MAARLRALEGELNDWFERKRRGRGTRVFVYPRDDGVWFLVRHGEPFQRAESLNGSETASVCYRPLKYDVLVYHLVVYELDWPLFLSDIAAVWGSSAKQPTRTSCRR